MKIYLANNAWVASRERAVRQSGNRALSLHHILYKSLLGSFNDKNTLSLNQPPKEKKRVRPNQP